MDFKLRTFTSTSKILMINIFLSLMSSAVVAQKKPNIIFILVDDMGYYSLGAFGQRLIKTPNLDRLAANGMKLTNFYSNHICSPSRGSLLTGMHTGNGLVRGNYELGGYTDDTEYGQMPLPL